MTTTPERAGREGDTQPLPTKSDSPHMHDLVRDDLRNTGHPLAIAIEEDLAARKALGIKRYGQPLQAHNGRNPRLDAYEEVLDLLAYLRQAIFEIPLWEMPEVSPLPEAYEHALQAALLLKESLDA